MEATAVQLNSQVIVCRLDSVVDSERTTRTKFNHRRTYYRQLRQQQQEEVVSGIKTEDVSTTTTPQQPTKAVEVYLELGHRAALRSWPTPEGFTHDWIVYVRCADCSPTVDLQQFIDKVEFHLHESFRKPRRTVKEPPYQIAETGYGGFTLRIDINVKNCTKPRRIRFNYDLFLGIGPKVAHHRIERLIFTNPSQRFYQRLIRAGATCLSNGPQSIARRVSAVCTYGIVVTKAIRSLKDRIDSSGSRLFTARCRPKIPAFVDSTSGSDVNKQEVKWADSQGQLSSTLAAAQQLPNLQRSSEKPPSSHVTDILVPKNSSSGGLHCRVVLNGPATALRRSGNDDLAQPNAAINHKLQVASSPVAAYVILDETVTDSCSPATTFSSARAATLGQRRAKSEHAVAAKPDSHKILQPVERSYGDEMLNVMGLDRVIKRCESVDRYEMPFADSDAHDVIDCKSRRVTAVSAVGRRRKRTRGRSRATKGVVATKAVQFDSNGIPIKRGRGRPRKVVSALPTQIPRTPAETSKSNFAEYPDKWTQNDRLFPRQFAASKDKENQPPAESLPSRSRDFTMSSVRRQQFQQSVPSRPLLSALADVSTIDVYNLSTELRSKYSDGLKRFRRRTPYAPVTAAADKKLTLDRQKMVQPVVKLVDVVAKNGIGCHRLQSNSMSTQDSTIQTDVVKGPRSSTTVSGSTLCAVTGHKNRISSELALHCKQGSHTTPVASRGGINATTAHAHGANLQTADDDVEPKDALCVVTVPNSTTTSVSQQQRTGENLPAGQIHPTLKDFGRNGHTTAINIDQYFDRLSLPNYFGQPLLSSTPIKAVTELRPLVRPHLTLAAEPLRQTTAPEVVVRAPAANRCARIRFKPPVQTELQDDEDGERLSSEEMAKLTAVLISERYKPQARNDLQSTAKVPPTEINSSKFVICQPSTSSSSTGYPSPTSVILPTGACHRLVVLPTGAAHHRFVPETFPGSTNSTTSSAPSMRQVLPSLNPMSTFGSQTKEFSITETSEQRPRSVAAVSQQSVIQHVDHLHASASAAGQFAASAAVQQNQQQTTVSAHQHRQRSTVNAEQQKADNEQAKTTPASGFVYVTKGALKRRHDDVEESPVKRPTVVASAAVREVNESPPPPQRQFVHSLPIDAITSRQAAPNGLAVARLLELQQKLSSLSDRTMLRQIVRIITETGKFLISETTFDFDLCKLDQCTVEKLLRCISEYR